MSEATTDDRRPDRKDRMGEPIGISWGRVGRQVLAFLMAVAGILLLLEHFAKHI